MLVNKCVAKAGWLALTRVQTLSAFVCCTTATCRVVHLRETQSPVLEQFGVNVDCGMRQRAACATPQCQVVAVKQRAYARQGNPACRCGAALMPWSVRHAHAACARRVSCKTDDYTFKPTLCYHSHTHSVVHKPVNNLNAQRCDRGVSAWCTAHKLPHLSLIATTKRLLFTSRKCEPATAMCSYMP
jgi:hypothetical protein